jgi:hypothetical protein
MRRKHTSAATQVSKTRLDLLVEMVVDSNDRATRNAADAIADAREGLSPEDDRELCRLLACAGFEVQP